MGEAVVLLTILKDLVRTRANNTISISIPAIRISPITTSNILGWANKWAVDLWANTTTYMECIHNRVGQWVVLLTTILCNSTWEAGGCLPGAVAPIQDIQWDPVIKSYSTFSPSIFSIYSVYSTIQTSDQ